MSDLYRILKWFFKMNIQPFFICLTQTSSPRMGELWVCSPWYNHCAHTVYQMNLCFKMCNLSKYEGMTLRVQILCEHRKCPTESWRISIFSLELEGKGQKYLSFYVADILLPTVCNSRILADIYGKLFFARHLKERGLISSEVWKEPTSIISRKGNEPH